MFKFDFVVFIANVLKTSKTNSGFLRRSGKESESTTELKFSTIKLIVFSFIIEELN